MIITLPPPWALGGAALHAQDDPHVADGVHYRLFSDPRMGLPMRPVYVWRDDLGLNARTARSRLPNFPARRHDITWTDSHGRTLLAPFVVTPDNPVTGVLPTHGLSRCIWLSVDTTRRSEIRADIYRDSTRGRRFLGARDTAPLSLAAGDIDGVVVSGDGVVQELTWLDVWRLEVGFDETRRMALPRDRRDRYDPLTATPVRNARDRVRRSAPTRLGLHDEPDAADPAGATLSTADDEQARIEALSSTVDDPLDALLDDLTAPQHRLELVDQLTEGDISPEVHDSEDLAAEAAYKPSELIHAAMHDPTMARWLGFMDADLPDDFEPAPGHVVMYQLWSCWAVDPTALTPAEIVSWLPSLPGLITDPNGYETVPGAEDSPDGLPIFAFWVPAVAVGHAPPLAPAAPVVDAEAAPTSPATADGLGHWLPETPPAARRQATMPIAGLAPAAGLAAATDVDSTVTGLNERVEVRGGTIRTRALLTVPSVPADADAPDTGRLYLRSVPPEGCDLRVSQSDVFGRWSPWTEREVAAKIRPRPPAPVFDQWYAMADPEGAGTGPRWGALTAHVQVPQPAALAPGSLPLERVRLDGTVDGAPFSIDAPAPAVGDTEVVVEIAAPAPGLLAVGQIVEAVTTARWIDTAGTESVDSDPRRTTCTDPRPAAPLAVDPELAWTARPDATGRARVRLDWPASGPDRYRVYGCDEQRILQRAEDAGLSAFLADHAAAADLPARADVLRDHHASFDPAWFENLTDDPLEADGTGALSFQHELSGSLGVLAVYKVVAETEVGVAGDFSAAPLWVWAVPERSGPPRPLLELVGTSPGPPVTATLRVRLTGNTDAAARFRLRRSAIHSDPRRMPVASEEPIVLTGDDKQWEIVDHGPFLHDPDYELRLGPLYSWTVEVQSPDLPGSARPGPWSEPSAAVGTRILAPAADDGGV